MEKSKQYLSMGKTMLVPSLLILSLLSCKKENLETQASSENFEQEISTAPLATSTSTSQNLIFEENFEGSTPFATYVNKQMETSYALTRATSPVLDGSGSGRFELRDTDPMNNNGTRAEVSFPSQSGLDRWYAFSVYFPSADYKYDNEDELINQWHQGGGVTPSITLGTKEDKYRLIVKETPTTKQTYDLGAIAKDKWNTFVFHIKHSSSSNGLIELWLNGQKVVNRTGINMYELTSGKFYSPKWKLGVYKSAWNNSNTTLVNKRVLFYDNVRLGSEKATYEEMTALGSAPAPQPEPQPEPQPGTEDPATNTNITSSPITSFTLVSAHTEKDIMTIHNGAQISLATIYKLTRSYKLNIRANTNSSTVKSVKMELSGKQSKNFVDNTAPFTLHGDSGTNYYYGNWNAPSIGTYTLKATPYSTSDASGTAGTSNTITFSFIK